jgi:hypothetical protein
MGHDELMPAITHIVLVEWKNCVRSEALAELDVILDAFRTEIPGVVDVSFGPSMSPEHLEAGYDWALVVTFANAVARDVYLDHPAHAPVAAFIGAWNERLVVFDLATTRD